MRPRLLELLACPACGAPLAAGDSGDAAAPAGADGRDGAGDLEGGEILCRCGERYPILSGVPSLLPRRDDGRPRPDPRTPESFGLQWTTYEYGDHTWFKDLDLRVRELPAILDVPTAALRGRRMLDAGCGHGALTAAIAAAYDLETVGLDMSAGVFRAEERRRARPAEEASRVHYVHGDILRPPLREGAFPFLISIGVLHHTPDPEGGLRALVKRLEPGGRIYIQMYRRREPWIGLPNAAVRAVTTRLPPRATLAICSAAVPLHTAAVRAYARLRGERSPIGTFTYRERLVSLFDNFSPRYQFRYRPAEILAMFERAGLRDARDVTLANEARQVIGVVGTKA